MATIKISELTAKTTLSGSEEILINDSGVSKKMLTSLIKDIQTDCETAQTAAEAAQTAAEAAQTAAETAETNAETAETNAAASASAASTSETNAANSATSSANSATASANSATAASNAQTAAEAARDSALAAYDNFDDRYLGVKASDPTLDNDGNALVAGSLYFNSVSESMKLYTGSAWVDAYTTGSGFISSGDNVSELTNDAGYLTSFTETDPIYTASSWYTTTNNSSNWDTSYGWGDHASVGYLTSFTETNDLTAAVTWANIPDTNVPQSAVTQHQAALSITESQISDLGSYLEDGFSVTAGTLTTANITTADFGNWTITESGGVLYFATGGTNKMKLDASGNLTVVGDVTAYGTV